MEYNKNLIVLSGSMGKCAITIETTLRSCKGYLFATDKEQRLYLVVKQKNKNFVTQIKSRIIEFPFNIDRDAHIIVVEGKSMQVVLYGTQDTKKMWQANMLDGVKKEIENQERRNTEIDTKTIEAKIEKEAETPIMGLSSFYNDEAIALSDYYPKSFKYKVKEKSILNNFYKDFSGKSSVGAKMRFYLDGYNQSIKSQSTKVIHNEEEENGEKRRSITDLQKQYYSNNSNQNKSAGIKSFLHNDEVSSIKSGKSISERMDSRENVRVFGDTAQVAPTACIKKEQEKSIKNKDKSTFVFKESKSKVVPSSVNFYEQIKQKLDKLFLEGERHKKLEEMMPQTKWVKVAYEENKYYLVGIIGERPDYICYGMPGTYQENQPDELDGFCRWMPLDVTRPQGNGFWLMYQDAITGESVEEGGF